MLYCFSYTSIKINDTIISELTKINRKRIKPIPVTKTKNTDHPYK